MLMLMLAVSPTWAALIDFESVPLAPSSANPATAADHSDIVFGEAVFNRSWSEEFDCCPSGWAVSNQTDLASVGFGNALSAYVLPTGGGYLSPNYAVANNLSRGESTVQFDRGVRVEGMYVTNSSYTYHSVFSGDDGAGFVKGPFAEGDWLKLEVIGLDATGVETGRMPVILADYRDGASTVIDEWTWVELTSLGDHVAALEFEMSSTDAGPFGMNTPAYFAVDNLTYSVVPEPSTLGLCLLAALGLSWRRLVAASPN